MNFSQLLKFFNDKLGSSFLCAFDHASKKALNDFKCLQVIYAYVLVRSGAERSSDGPSGHQAEYHNYTNRTTCMHFRVALALFHMKMSFISMTIKCM